jgi:hypothetical protein
MGLCGFRQTDGNFSSLKIKGGIMAQTVIGFFKDADDAQKALQRLETKGISRQQVDISRGQYLDATADRDGRNTNRVTDFFNKLFGHDSDDAKRYSTVGQSNVTIVTVHAASSDLAEEAADILDDCGAIDVDEHASGTGDTTRTTTTGTTGLDTGIGREQYTGGTTTDESATDPDEGVGLGGGLGSGFTRGRSRIVDRSVDDDTRLRDDF